MSVVLIAVAHPDDESIGMGGAVARLVSEGHDVYVGALADGCTSRLQATAHDVLVRWQQWAGALSVLGAKPLYPHRFYPDQQLDTVPRLELTRQIEAWIQEVHPQEVYTHAPGDTNLDHRVVWEAAQPAVRPRSGVRGVWRFRVRCCSGFSPTRTVWLTEAERQKRHDALLCYGQECAGELETQPEVEWFEEYCR